MNTETDLVLKLHKTNVDLQLGIVGLVQESARRWLEPVACATDDSLAETAAEAGRLSTLQGWQALAASPGEAFWRPMLLCAGDAESAAKMGLEAQASFFAGLCGAIQTWQEETARLVDESGVIASFGKFWNDLLRQWGQFSPAAPTAAPTNARKTIHGE